MKVARTLSLFSLACLTSCGGSSGVAPDASAAQEGAVSITLGSHGHPALVSLTTRVSSIGFVDSHGLQTLPFHTEPLVVEWVGLSEEQMWIGRHELPRGDYVGLFVNFDPRGTWGVMEDGSLVDFETEVQAFLPFAETRPVNDEPLLSCVELDLVSSVQLDGTPRFQAAGRASGEFPPVPAGMLYGVVGDVEAGGTIVVAAFADVEGLRPLGRLEVVSAETAWLLDEAGEVFPSLEAFHGSLRPGLSLLELEGDLQGSARLRATRIQIIDPALGQGTSLPVRIEGMLTALRASGFEMSVRRVLTGGETARPVLEGLDSPERIEVLVDDRTRVLAEGDGTTPIRPDVGHALLAEFREFASEPFPAGLVIVRRSQQCFRGAVDETDARTGFVLVSRPADPDGVPERLHVSVGDAPIVLLLRGRPLLSEADLVTGTVAEACGTLDELGDRRRLEARSVQVHPGFLARATVSTFDAAERSFRTADGFVVQSFGANVESGPLSIRLEDRVVVGGDVDSVDRFFELLAELPDDERVLVEGKGLGDGEPQSVRLFELTVFRVASGGDG